MTDLEEVQVSVVVCAYTQARLNQTVRAVQSAYGQRPAPLETVVVVDHNNSLLEVLREELPGVEVVGSRGPKGLSGARNTGIEVAKGDVVAFLDDDAVAEPGWVGRLRSAYVDPAVVAAGGTIAPMWPQRRPSFLAPEFDWVVGCTFVGMPRSGDEVRNLIGANMSFRASVLAEVGGFDAAMGRRVGNLEGGEETELCIRARQQIPGARIKFVDDARVNHEVAAQRTTLGYFVRRCFAEGASKAALTSLRGAGQGLSSEREYTFRVIPGAIFRDLRAGKVGRVAASTIGVLAAGIGFVTRTMQLRLQKR